MSGVLGMAVSTTWLGFPQTLLHCSSPRVTTTAPFPRRSLTFTLPTNKPLVLQTTKPRHVRAYSQPNNNMPSPTVAKALQASLWLSEAAYVAWLFVLPFAPGDPVWAISADTVDSLLRLSLNFFLILPLLNSVGVHALEAPVVHPMSEALFNFVIGWTFMFAPLLFTDRRRDRFSYSLDGLWAFQMFLTNTFLIPYMAIRLNESHPERAPQGTRLQSLMTSNANVVGLVGAVVCLVSLLWGIFGRPDPSFGGVSERWDFLIGYVGSERLAYAFLWDICFYSVFQPWLIRDNLQNVDETKAGLVSGLAFVPVIGLLAYLVFLNRDDQL